MMPASLLALLLFAAALPHVTCGSHYSSTQIAKRLGDITKATECPDATWKVQFFKSQAIQSRKAPVVIFDIGCNKGFDAISTLQLFSQNFSVSAEVWANTAGFHGCGWCQQCHNRVPREPQALAKKVKLHCVEPLPANYEALQRGARVLHLSEQGLQVVHGAFTSRHDAETRAWSASFPVGPGLAGVENFGIDVNTAGGWLLAAMKRRKGLKKHDKVGQKLKMAFEGNQSVPLLVLDDYVQKYRVKQIDILSIDTEGNDALVLAGGNRTLPSMVRYVEFEVHKFGAWQQHSLSSVVLRLADAGFVCYWTGKSKLWRITDYWHPAYDKKTRGNVGCVHRREAEWLGIMEGFFNSTMHSR